MSDHMIDQTTLRDARYTVLGLLMVDDKHRGEALARLTDRHFDQSATAPVYRAIRELHFTGAPISDITLTEKLGNEYSSLLLACLDKCRSSGGGLLHYCDVLDRQAQLVALRELGAAMSVVEDTDEANRILDELNGMMVPQRAWRVVSAADAAGNFLDALKAQNKPNYLKISLPELDRELRSELGDFIVIGGYASSGKTLLSLQMLRAIVAEHRVGYFSLETGSNKLANRMIASMARVPLGKIKDRDLHEADYAAVGKAASDLSQLAFDYIEASGMSVSDIRALALNRRYDVIFVDYLQIVRGDERRSAYEKVSQISMALHELAQRNKITVIALAQLNRGEKSGKNGKRLPPSLSSLRESGQIEQDADIVMLLWPEDLNNNKSRRVLKVAKNKDGEHLKLMLDFDGATQTMSVAKPTYSESMAAIRAAGKQAARDERAAQRKAEAKQMAFAEIAEPDEDLPF